LAGTLKNSLKSNNYKSQKSVEESRNKKITVQKYDPEIPLA